MPHARALARIASAILILSSLACGSPVRREVARAEKVRELLGGYVTRKYEMLESSRRRLRSDAAMVRALDFTDGVKDFSDSDAEVAARRAEEERNLKFWWESIERSAKADANVRATSREQVRGLQIFYRNVCLQQARVRLFNLQTDKDRAENDRILAWRIERVGRDLGSTNPFAQRQLAAYGALREYRQALRALADETFAKVESLCRGD